MVNSFLQANSFCAQVLCSVSWVYFHWPQRTDSCQRLDHPAPERRWIFPCYGQDTEQRHSGKNPTGSTCSKNIFKVVIRAWMISLNMNFALERLECCRENQRNFSLERSVRICLWGVPRGWRARCEVLQNTALLQNNKWNSMCPQARDSWVLAPTSVGLGS